MVTFQTMPVRRDSILPAPTRSRSSKQRKPLGFPGTVVPLHVFEPRYRQLVRDCVRDDRMVGICHTRKTIRKAKRNQTVTEMLSSNQATYQPQEIFSAGECEIIEPTDDGRIMARITMRQRLVIIKDVQSLP